MIKKASFRGFIFFIIISLLTSSAWATPAFAATSSLEPAQSAFAEQNGGPGDGTPSSPTKSGKGESCKSGNKGKGSKPTDSGKTESLKQWGAGQPTGPQLYPGTSTGTPAPQPGEEELTLVLKVGVQPDPSIGVIQINPWPQIEEKASYRSEHRAFHSGIFKYVTGKPLEINLAALVFNRDWVFDHWDITFADDTNNQFHNNPTTVTLRTVTDWWTGSTTAIAVFVRVYNLTVSCTDGGSVTLGSSKTTETFRVNPGPTGTDKVREGSIVTLTPVPDKAKGYVFDGWKGVEKGDTIKEDGSLVLKKMGSDRTIRAKFKQITPPPQDQNGDTTPPTSPPSPPTTPSPLSWIIRTSVSPAGGGSVSPNTGASGTKYLVGSSVSITATPATGYEFSHWSGDASGSTSSIKVNMTSDKTVTANFKLKVPVLYMLRTSVSPAGGGSVNPTTGALGKAYGANTSVTITATPATGYKFSHWSGDASGSVSPVTVIMNSNKTITANFTMITTPPPPPPPPQY